MQPSDFPSDLVGQLRYAASTSEGDAYSVCDKAADKIERLSAALLNEWELNHAEHCCNPEEGCESYGGTKRCHYPRLKILEK